MNADQRKIIEQAIVAMNDWLHQYAPELCNEKDVRESTERIAANGGTLAYNCNVRMALENLLKDKSPERPKFMIGDIVEFTVDYGSYKKGDEKFVYGVSDWDEDNIHHLRVDCGASIGDLPQEWFKLKFRLRDLLEKRK